MIKNGTIQTQAINGMVNSFLTDTVLVGGSYVRQLRFYDANGTLFYTLQLSAPIQSALEPIPPPNYMFPHP